MAFPTTGLLDNFNRSDGDLGSNWPDVWWVGTPELVISGNKAMMGASGSSSVWHKTFGPDCEVWAQVPVRSSGDMILIARAHNVGLSNFNGYELVLSGSDWQFYWIDTSTGAPIGTNATQAIADGSWVGMEVVGNDLRAYYKAPAGSWTQILNVTDGDAHFTTAGKIGMECDTSGPAWDDFAGGTIDEAEVVGLAVVDSAVTAEGINPTSGDWDLSTISWEQNDLAIFWWHTRLDAKTITEEAAITQSLDSVVGDSGRLFVGYRWLLNSDDDIFSFTSSSVAGSPTTWGVIVIRGGQGYGNPFDATSGAGGSQHIQTVNPDPPAVTSLTDNALVLTFLGSDDDWSGAPTPPSGYTLQAWSTIIGTGGQDESTAIATKALTSAATEDPGTWTILGTVEDDHLMWTVAIREGIFIFPGSGANGLAGDVAWSNPSFVTYDDGSSATVTMGADQASAYLAATDFGIVATGLVEGIEIEVEYSGATLGVGDFLTAQMTKNGTGPVGSTFLSLDNGDPANTYYRGGATDLFATSWSEAEVEASTFGVVILAYNESGGDGYTAGIDSVRVKVHFAEPAEPVPEKTIFAHQSS